MLGSKLTNATAGLALAVIAGLFSVLNGAAGSPSATRGSRCSSLPGRSGPRGVPARAGGCACGRPRASG
jgi:hypothetical protein